MDDRLHPSAPSAGSLLCFYKLGRQLYDSEYYIYLPQSSSAGALAVCKDRAAMHYDMPGTLLPAGYDLK